METDIGQPFQYTPTPPSTKDEEEDSTPLVDEGYHQPPPPPQHQNQQWMSHDFGYGAPPPPPSPPQKFDLGSLDKNTLVIAFAVFLLGFFMGKTMQPVILRSH
jgi:hypothetical protein